MSEPFVGEIRPFPYPWVPQNWAACEGQLLQIASNQTLYALLGTNFGGDGRVTFALPDLRGRTPMHLAASGVPGDTGGAEQVTLTSGELAPHTHAVKAGSAEASVRDFDGSSFAAVRQGAAVYGAPGQLQPLASDMVTASGGGQPHPNCQPSLVIQYCIALSGIFPSRN